MDQLIREVRELLPQVPAPPNIALPEGAGHEELLIFKASLGMDVPPELEDWLRISDGPLVGPGGLFGITRDQPDDRRACTIQECLTIFPAWRSMGWIPVAGDGCGNYYVLSISNPTANGHGVFFVDTLVDPLKPAYVVASDLWRFLKFLLRKELGSSHWPFNQARVLEEDPELKSATGAPLPWKLAR